MIQAHIKKGQVFSTNKSVQNTIYLTMKDASKIELPIQYWRQAMNFRSLNDVDP